MRPAHCETNVALSELQSAPSEEGVSTVGSCAGA